MKYLLMIFGLVIFFASLGYMIFRIVKFCKFSPLGGASPKIDEKERIYLIALIIICGLASLLTNYGFVVMGNMPLAIGEHFSLIIGSLFFGISFPLLISSFALYYYRPDLDPKQRKIARILTFVSIPFVFIGLWLFTNGMADYMSYPLPNGLSFVEGFVTPGRGSGFTISFYGILVVSGGVSVYFIVDHKFYQKFGKHGLIDTLFIVSFLSGLIGARLWYCLVLEPKVYFADPIRIFQVWDGGLGVMGGALLGVAAGVTFVLVFRKYVNIRWAMDIIIPTILIGQVIGRWGNFFNCEVYGMESSISNWWFLPKVIMHNAQYSSSGAYLGDGMLHTPLFIIESVINLCGYFIIRYAIGKPLKKYLALGDLAMCYFIWYGLVRAIMEPLRDGSFEYNTSWITAFVLIGGGLLGILAFHLYDFIRMKKGLPPRNLDTI